MYKFQCDIRLYHALFSWQFRKSQHFQWNVDKKTTILCVVESDLKENRRKVHRNHPFQGDMSCTDEFPWKPPANQWDYSDCRITWYWSHITMKILLFLLKNLQLCYLNVLCVNKPTNNKLLPIKRDSRLPSFCLFA